MSYMKYLLDLDTKNGKRPMEIDSVDELYPRKCTKMLDSCHIVESVQISFQQQSFQPKDSVIEPVSVVCHRVQEGGDWNDDGDSIEVCDHQFDQQQQEGQPVDSSDSGIPPFDEKKKQHLEDLLGLSDQQSDE